MEENAAQFIVTETRKLSKKKPIADEDDVVSDSDDSCSESSFKMPDTPVGSVGDLTDHVDSVIAHINHPKEQNKDHSFANFKTGIESDNWAAETQEAEDDFGGFECAASVKPIHLNPSLLVSL
ncbi:hypothetical protein Ciccas_005365 [Cichlidogyrus casuarinus]|uniref:Uncharacterized protein n=1 Tax=Cichlidogyrus casuarinus TaxID=1844966 RepID=A0ABD2Q8V9_9PLAT